MKISRTLAAAALSGALVLGGTTVAFAANEGVPLSDTLVYNGVTYYKNSNGDYAPAADSKDESGKDVDEVITAADMETHVKNGEAKAPESSDSSTTASATTTKSSDSSTTASATTTKSSDSSTTASATTTKSSDSSTTASATTTKSSDSSTTASATTTKSSDSSTTASATTTPSASKSAEPTPSKDKKSSARDALSSKEGKPTPLAIFGIVAGVLAAVAAAFPVIAKTLNLNIKLPF